MRRHSPYVLDYILALAKKAGMAGLYILEI